MAKQFSYGMGWSPDLPDHRDRTFRHRQISKRLLRLKPLPTRREQVDLREFLSNEWQADPSEHISPAVACLGLLEYFERRRGRTFEGSAQFLHHMARRQAQLEGAAGISIRTTLKAIRRFGVPPHRLMTSDESGEALLDPALFSYSRRYHSLAYFRLDFPRDIKTEDDKGEATRGIVFQDTLKNLRSFLEAGFPVVFGISVPASCKDQILSEPRSGEAIIGGQAVLCVGYQEGNVLIRSSWGTAWGDNGYSWLPLSFILRGYAADFWTIFKPKWLTKDLRCPSTMRNP